jgi:gamma-glutamylcyclotransferase (GGCT)/AIG2-like uncharacterized protein YtfP
MNIFTYGSLMFGRVWSAVVTGTYVKTQARLFGYQRRKLRGETYPALIPGAGEDYVDGIIYFDIDSNDSHRLDQFEGAYYTKKLETCTLTDSRLVPAHVYVFRPEYNALVEEEAWSPEWFEKIGIQSFMAAYRGYDRINPTDGGKKI